MAIYGYARVSTTDQDLTIQRDALIAAGCVAVSEEKKSGTSTEGREALETLLKFAQTGDVIVVTRIDRLARSIADLAVIVKRMQDKGIELRATEQPVDTTTASGRAFLGMLGVFAQFETEIRKERQLEGIAKAKANGIYKGRQVNKERHGRIEALLEQGASSSQVMAQEDCARATVAVIAKALKARAAA